MGKVIVDLSMSLDGYIAGPNDGPGNGLGDGGEALFEWMNVNRDAYGTRDFINPPPASRDVAQQFLRAGLLDEIQVSVAPALLGGGIRLFGDGTAVALRQTRAIPSKGVTHLRYEVVK